MYGYERHYKKSIQRTAATPVCQPRWTHMLAVQMNTITDSIWCNPNNSICIYFFSPLPRSWGVWLLLSSWCTKREHLRSAATLQIPGDTQAFAVIRDTQVTQSNLLWACAYALIWKKFQNDSMLQLHPTNGGYDSVPAKVNTTTV